MEINTIDKICFVQKASLILLPIIFFLNFSTAFSQPKWQLEIHGVITENDKPLAGAKIASYVKGQEQEVIYTNAKGAFKINLNANAQYLVKMTKSGGYITKVVSFDTRNLPNSEDNNRNFNFPLDATLFKEFKGLDPSLLREPIGKVNYNTNKKQFVDDEIYTRNIQYRLDEAIKAMELAKALEIEFNTLIKRADQMMGISKIEEALKVLKRAADLQINDSIVKIRIEEANALLKIKSDAAEIEYKQRLAIEIKKFNELISEGDVLKNDASPELALCRYKSALALNVDNDLANEKIKQIEDILLKIKQTTDSADFANRKKKEFDRLINYGSMYMKSGYLKEAEDCFKKAAELKIDSLGVNTLLTELSYKLAGDNEKLRKKREVEERRNAFLEKARVERETARLELIQRLEARNSALAESARNNLERDQQKYAEKKELEMASDATRKALSDKYIEGITREEMEGTNYFLTRVIIIKGEQVTEYKKLQYSFGSIYFLKNGKDITEEIFENETK
jgi:tetratricopeptide (TPR) repeat protein